jgi:hypothetical protein
MSTFTAVVAQLEEERTRLASELDALALALSVLNKSRSNGTARPSRLSASARARIAAAQRARWAKIKNSKLVSISAGKKRKLSASALKHVRAAQKARWAKWRKQQKSA